MLVENTVSKVTFRPDACGASTSHLTTNVHVTDNLSLQILDFGLEIFSHLPLVPHPSDQGVATVKAQRHCTSLNITNLNVQCHPHVVVVPDQWSYFQSDDDCFNKCSTPQLATVYDTEVPVSFGVRTLMSVVLSTSGTCRIETELTRKTLI